MAKERKDKHFIKKPKYPGGPSAMRKFIRENLKYPKEAQENKIEGTVTIKYDIDYKGKVIDTHIISGLGFGCDEEADRLVRLLKFEVPRTRGVRVLFHKELHVHFRLPKKKKVPQQIGYQYVVTKPKKQAPVEKSRPSSGSYHYTLKINQPK